MAGARKLGNQIQQRPLLGKPEFGEVLKIVNLHRAEHE